MTESPPAGETTGDRWIRRVTTTAVVAVALVAAVVSYRHMRAVAGEYGEDRLNATIIPLSVDGLIVAASMLTASRAHRSSPWLSWVLLGAGSIASLAANVIHAEPTLVARVISAWPPFALMGAYELLTAMIRAHSPTRSATGQTEREPEAAQRADVVALPVRGRPGAAPREGERPRRAGTKRARLVQLLAETGDVGQRSAYSLARDLAPQVGLHEGTARRYIAEIRHERKARLAMAA